MSVYTRVSHEALADWLTPLALGSLCSLEGIAAGMQNSNYYVTTSAGRFVLTLFERIDTGALDFYLALQAHLARRGLPCPLPFATPDGRHWRPLAGKPAALFSCLPGAPLETASRQNLAELGRILAEMHAQAADFPEPQPNPCGPAWCDTLGRSLLPLLTADERALLADELAYQASQPRATLPHGVIHADLFRDNVLWESDGRLSGLLDFYFAGADALLFDLAVVANDWCVDAPACTALLAAYTARRPLQPAEMAAWPAMRRAAALRFWLLRLEVRHRPRSGDMVTIKDPEYFRRLLEQLRLAPDASPH